MFRNYFREIVAGRNDQLLLIVGGPTGKLLTSGPLTSGLRARCKLESWNRVHSRGGLALFRTPQMKMPHLFNQMGPQLTLWSMGKNLPIVQISAHSQGKRPTSRKAGLNSAGWDLHSVIKV